MKSKTELCEIFESKDDETFTRTFWKGSKYKPVREGGLVNHFQFYLIYLGVTIIFLYAILFCIVRADAIDQWFSRILKAIFL